MNASDRRSWVLLLTGTDGPNVLSALFDALARSECTLGDLQVARLAGHFSGVVVFDAPAETTAEALQHAFDALWGAGARIELSEVPSAQRALRHRPESRPFVVSYSGAHRPEMVRALSHALDDFGCEFVSMSGHVSLGHDAEAHILVCEVDAPGGTALSALQHACDAVGARFGLDLLVMPADLDDVSG